MKAPLWLKDGMTWGYIDRIPWWARICCPTLHWCWDFDGLAIDKYDLEWECCHCFEEL